MKNSLHQHAQIAIHLSIFAAVLMLSSYISHTKTAHVRETLVASIKQNEQTMMQFSELTDSNSADEETLRIITDCSRRTDFESLRLRISTLSKQDVLSLQSMYEKCGSYYPTQKAIMVSKLKKEFEFYLASLNIYRNLSKNSDISKNKFNFEQIIQLEEQRSMLLAEQNVILAQIITQLVSGKNATSKSVTDLLARDKDIVDLLTVTDQQIDRYRADINI